jgi:hypothetical protein
MPDKSAAAAVFSTLIDLARPLAQAQSQVGIWPNMIFLLQVSEPIAELGK